MFRFRNGSEPSDFLIVHELGFRRVKKRRAAGVAIAVLEYPVIAGVADSIRARSAPLPQLQKLSCGLEFVQLSRRLHFIPCPGGILCRARNQQVFSDVPDPPALLAPV